MQSKACLFKRILVLNISFKLIENNFSYLYKARITSSLFRDRLALPMETNSSWIKHEAAAKRALLSWSHALHILIWTSEHFSFSF